MTALVPEQATYPRTPTVEPIDGTLLSIVRSQGGVENLGAGEGLFESFNCLETGFNPGVICGPMTGDKLENAQRPSWVDGFAFVGYGLVICKMPTSDLKVGIESAYTAAESRIVERAVMETGLNGAEDITPTPGTAVDPVVGLGLLESHMAAHYAGKGVIHMPRITATYLANQGVVEMDDDEVLYTSLKTPVAAGGGYDLPNVGPTGADAPAGKKWIYGSGRVLLLKKTVVTGDVHVQPVNITGLDANNQIALAERSYIAAIDCYTAAVLVNV